MTVNLWDIDHPYYCSEGSYWVPGNRWHEVHTLYDSWKDFYEEWGSNDPELNLLFRWDWLRISESDLKYLEPGEDPSDVLCLFYMMQRKARNCSIEVKVTEDDQSEIRNFLAARAENMKSLWEPFL